jgi:fumarylacetoacetase
VTGSWIDDDEFGLDHPFGPQTLPYGVIDAGDGPTVAVRTGQHAVPLRGLAGALGPRLGELVAADSLNPLLGAARPTWQELRERLTELVTAATRPRGGEAVALDRLTTRLPFTVGDYVDFYSSRQHAENAGAIFRPGSPALLPNWTHLPVGYHGRAGTVLVSGTDVPRPHGQRAGADGVPVFGPSTRLDVEAEVGFVCGGPIAARVPTSALAEHVFGVALVNDWSARDIQGWEGQPLGPFLAKSFATSLAAWITPLEAFAAAWVDPPEPAQELLPYLRCAGPTGLDIALEVRWNDTVVSRPPFASMNWTAAQQLAHLTVNGATVRPGDLFASGTVTGPDRGQRGSFLELSWGGAEPVTLADGATRTFLEDGDTVVITGTAPGPDGHTVGLAEVAGTVLAADTPGRG